MSAEAGRLRILCPAAFSERKGHQTLLDASRHCVEGGIRVELFFCGAGTAALVDGDSRDQFRTDWASGACAAFKDYVNAGGTAHALGHVSDEELERLYSTADVVVFPSDYEGFGLPVAEAVQRGLPVIASNLPPIREQLALFDCHERVRLVTPGDVGALAQALSDFAGCRAPLRKSRNEMAPHFLRWTWGDAAGKVVEDLRQRSA